MKTSLTPSRVLVLGVKGMVGHTVYSFLKAQPTLVAFGTARKREKNVFAFDAKTPNTLDKIIKDNKINFIINCIGILQNSNDLNQMRYINGEFPHILSIIAQKNHAYLIHISTDAVFSPQEKKVYEDTPPTPYDLYGRTKLKGEVNNNNTLTFRTSFLGLDPTTHKGLLEWALGQKEVTGFTNQKWSGCTTLQFAKLLPSLFKDFQKLRATSPVYHFTPILGTTKYAILSTFFRLLNSQIRVKKSVDTPVTRILSSRYQKLLNNESFSITLEEALADLLKFEKHTLHDRKQP